MDLCTLGAATIVNATGQYGLPRANCQRVIDDTAENDEQAEDLGDASIACALGVTALPAPPDDTGAAEGIFDVDVAGQAAIVVAAWDARSREVAGQMSPGDTCLHGTHSDATKRAKFFAKEDVAAIVVGNDIVLSLDRGGNTVTLAAFGHVLQVSKDSGILIAEKSGGNWIELKGGNNSIVGPTVIGGAGAGPLVLASAMATAFTAAASSCGADVGAAAAFTALAAAVAEYSTKQTMAT
jgi:hypothetical protein